MQNVKCVTRGIQEKLQGGRRWMKGKLAHKSAGIDGIIVTVGLCITALVLCVIFKDEIAAFLSTIVSSMTQKGLTMLNGTTPTPTP